MKILKDEAFEDYELVFRHLKECHYQTQSSTICLLLTTCRNKQRNSSTKRM